MFGTQPVVTIQDAYGNTATGNSSSVTVTINTGSGSLQGTTTVAAVNGIASFSNLRIDTAGAKTLQLTDGALTSVNTSPFTVSPAAASQLAVSTQPAGATAGAAFTTQPVITIQDAYGNTATGNNTNVTATLNSGSGTLTGTATVAAVNGIASFSNLRIDTAGAKTLQLTDGALTSVNSGSFTVTAAAASQLALTTQPAGATAGAAFATQPVLAVQDAFGNTVTGNSSNVTATINTGSGSLQGTVTVAAVAGVVSFSNLRIDTAGAKTLQLTDGALTSVNTSPFTVSPAAASQLVVSTQPAGATAGAAFTTQPVVSVQDAYGNTITSDTSNVTATLNSGTGSLAGTTTVAAVNGIASFSNLRIDTAGAKSLHFADGALTAVNSGSFTVSPAAASQLALTTQPAGATAGAAFTTQPVVTVQDAYGNTVTGNSSNVTATINSGSGTLTGTATVAAVNGIASFSNLRIDTAGAKSLHFADGALTAVNSGSFTVSPAAASQLVVSTQPAGATAGAPFTTQPVISVQDAFGNTVTGDSSSVTATLNSGSGSLAGTTTVAAVNGIASFSNLRIDTAGAKTLQLTDGALTSVNSGSFTVSPGAASQLVVSTQPAGATAGSVFVTQPVLAVQDAFGNTVTSDTSSVTATINSGTGSLAGTTTVAAVNGVASFTNLRIDTAGAKTLQFADGALTAVNSGSFTVSPAAAATLQVASGSSQTAGTAFSTTVTAKDAFGNTASGYLGTVHFTSSDPQALLPSNYSFLAADNGTHTFTNAVTLKTAGAENLIATDTITATITGTQNGISVTAAAASQLALSTQPAGATAGAPFTTQPLLTVQDAYGNTVTGDSSSVTATLNTGSGSLQGTATVAAVNGIASFSNLRIDSAGAKTLHFADGALTAVNSGSFTVSPAAASQLAVSTQPAGATAGAAFTTQPVVTVQDAYGNTATANNTNVTATLNSGSGTLTGTATVAAVNGIASFSNLRIDSAGAKTLHFTDAALTAVNTSPFTVSPAAASQLALTTQPAGATAGSVFGTQPVVTVRDAYGNTVTGDGSSVTATLNTGSGALAGTTTVAAVNGVASFSSLRIDTAGAKTLQFTDGALSSVNSGSFTVSPAAAATLQVSSGTSQTAGAPFSTTVTARDAFGNTASGYLGTVHFTSSDPQAVLPGNYSFLAGDNGTHTFSNAVTLKTAGAENLIATDTITTTITGTQNGISVTAAAASQLALSTQPAGATAGAAFTTQPVVTVQDAYGNTVTGDSSNVTATLNTGSGSLQGTTTVAAVNGIASFSNLRIDTAGAKTLQLTDGALTSVNTSPFTVSPAAASQLAVSTQPAGATAGAAFTTQPVISIQDAYGNTATGNNTNVTATLNSGSGTLTGTTTVAAVNGIASFSNLRIDTAGAKTLHFTDAALTAVNTSPFTVSPAAADHLDVSAAGSQTAGTPFSTTVTARDQFNNLATGYLGTVHFTSSDPLAVLPADYPFTGADGGTHSVSVTLKTAGSRSVTATDTLTGSINGTRSGISVSSATVDTNTSTLAASPTSVTADDTSTSTITAVLRDAFGNPVAGKSVSLALIGGGASTIAGSPATTDAGGVAQFSVKDGTAETQTYRVTDTTDSAVVSQTADVAFTPGTGSTSTSTISVAPGSIVADGSSTATVTVRLKDSLGNNLTSSGGTVGLSTTAGSLSLVTDNGDGTYTATLTSPTTAGNASITGTLNGIGLATSAAVSLVPGPATKVELTGSVVDLASGAARVFTGTVEDANGNTINSDNSTVVTIAQTAGPGTASGGGSATVSSGVSSRPLTAVLTGSVTVTASAAGLSPSSVTFAVVPGAATQLALADSGSSASGNAHALTATVQDAAGNTVTSDTSSVTFSRTAGPGTITGLGSANAVAGVATLNVTNRLVGSITVGAADDALATASTSWTIAPGTASKLALADSGSTASGATHTLTATVQDAAGNTVTSDASSVDFAQSSGAGSVTGLGSANAVAGVATLNVTNRLAGPITIDANDGSLTGGSTSWTVVPGAAAKLIVSGSSSNLTAGATRAVTATVEDAAGNQLLGDNSTVVSFAKTGGSGGFTGGGSATASGGAASKTLTGTTAGAVTVTASSGSLTTDSLSFTVVPGAVDAAQSSLTAAPGSALADGVASSTLTVTLKDTYGNQLSGLSVAPSQGSAGSTIAPASANTTAGGVATFSLTDTTPETVTYTVAGVTQTAVVNFTAGALDHLVVDPADSSTTAGVGVTFTSEGWDNAGHDLGDFTSSSTFSISPDGSCAGSTCTASLAGAHTVTADNAGKSGSTTLSVTPGAASLTASTFTGTASSIVANGSSTSTVTLHLKDFFGNDLGASDGSTIILATDTGTIGTTTDNGDGSYSATVTSPTSTGTATVTATRNGSGFAQSFLVALTPGPVSAGVSTATAAPGSVTANGTSTATVTVTLKDANGNVVEGKSVSLGQGSGSSTIVGSPAATDAAGVATFTVKSTVAETVTYAAADTTDSTAIAQQPAVTFTPDSVSASQSSVVASASPVAADDIATSSITVTLKDANGNRVAGKSVSLDQGTGSSTITPPSATTNGSGVATFSVHTGTAQTVVYTATDTDDAVTVTQTATVQFHVGVASATTSQLSAAPSPIVANGSSTATVTVQLRDALGNDLTAGGDTVALNATLGTLSAVTDNGDGTYTATLTSSTSAGIASLTGSVNGSGLAAGTTISFVAGPVATLDVAAGSPQTAGTAFPVTVTAKDANGNTVPTYVGTVHFTTTDTHSPLLPSDYTFVGGDSGSHVFSVTLEGAGSQNVTAADGPVGGTSPAIAVGSAAVSAGTSTLAAAPSSATADGTQSTVTATLRDAYGNPVSGKSVSLVAGSGSSANPETPQTTDSAGAATFHVSDLVAESIEYTAIDTTDAITIAENATVTFTAGPLDHIAISPSSSTIVAGASETYTVTGFDAQNNSRGDITGSASFTVAPDGSCAGAVCTVNAVGGHTITANVSGKTAAATLTVSPDAASLLLSTISATPTTLEVGGATSTIAVQLKDQFGNDLAGSGGAVALTTTEGSLSAVTDHLDGTYTATLTSPNLVGVGVASVTATLNGSALASSAAVTIEPGPAQSLDVSPASTNQTAGSPFDVTVTAQDAFGNTATSYAGTVHFTTTGSASLPANTTLPGGQKTVSVTLNSAGSRTITATDTTATTVTGTSPAIAVSAGGVSAAQSTVVANPASVVHDGSTTTTITVTLNDAAGNPVANKTVSLAHTNGASLSGSPATTDASGVATFTATDTTVEQVVFSAIGDGVAIAQTATVDFTTGALDRIVVTPASATISAGATQTFQVEGYDSSNIDLGDVTGSSTIALDGVDCGGATCSSTAAGSYTITATNAGKTDTATLTVTAASASTSTSTITAGASPVTVSNPGGGTTITVRLKDSFGNNLVGGGDAVTIQSSLGTVGLVTDVGNGTYTAPLSSTVVGVASVTAKIGASSIASSTTVAFDPGAAATVALSTAGSSTAGSPVDVSATLRDSFGNVATGYTGTLQFTSSDGAATLPADYTFTGGDAGTHTFTATLKTAGSQTIHATDGSLNDSTGPISVAPGAVSAGASTVAAAPANVLADGTASTVTVSLKDAYGNPVSGKTVSLTKNPGASASISAASGPSSGAGHVTFNVADTVVEDVTFSATDLTDAVVLSGSGNVSFVAGGLASITISPSSSTISAGGSQAFSARGYDAVGHDLGDVTASTSFSIGPNGSCAGAACTATLAGAHTVTADDGGKVATASLTVNAGALASIAISPATATIASGDSQTYSATGADASGNSLGNVTSATTFTITPDGSCTGATCTASTAGVHVVHANDAGNLDTASLTVTGGGGGPGPDTTPPTVSSISGGGTTVTIVFNEALTGGPLPAGDFTVMHDGVADAVTASTASGSAVILTVTTAFAPGETGTVSYAGTSTKDAAGNAAAAFGPSPITVGGGGGGPSVADPATSTVSASGTPIADGVATATITVTLKTSGGAPVSGKTVTLASGSTTSVPSGAATTDASGQATFTATDTQVETVTYTATDTTDSVTVAQTAAVTFTAAGAGPDATPPTVSNVTGTDGTITINFNEDLLASSVPGVGDFTALVNLTPVAVTGVSVSGSTVTVSLANPLVSGDSVTIAYNGSSIKDLAGNAAAAFGPTPVTVSGGGDSGGGGSSSDNGSAVAPPPPPKPAPPPASFISVTPANGSVLDSLSQVEFAATITVHWVEITITPDGGGTPITLTDGWGTPYTVPVAALPNGGYTLTAKMIDGRYGSFIPVPVTSHFFIGPPPPPPPPPAPPAANQTAPGSPGQLTSSDGGVNVAWDGATFGDAVVIDITPVTDGQGVANGGRAIQVTARRLSDNARVTSLSGVLDIHFPNAPVDAIPASSEDNVVWAPLPALSSHDLPSGVSAAFFRDSSNTVHVLTTHLTYFGLLRAPSSKFALTVVGTVRHVIGSKNTVAARLQSTRPVAVVATLFAASGKGLRSWRLQAKAGTSIVRLHWPKAVRKTGIYKISFAASVDRSKVVRTIRVRLVDSKRRTPSKRPVDVIVSGPSVQSLRTPGIRLVAAAGESTFTLTGRVDRNVGVIVLDVDRYGLPMLRDLHALFPEVRIVAISKDARTLAIAIRKGATVALPATTPTAQLGSLIGRLALQPR